MDPGDWLATKPQLDPESTPIEFHYKPDPLEVKGRLIVGLGVAGVAALSGYFLRDDGFALLVAGGFGLTGLLLAVYGTLQSRFSMSVVISGLDVSVEKTAIWGASKWRESLHRYQGVLLREVDLGQRGTSNIRTVKRYGIVELVHAEPAKNVVLFVKEGGEPPSAIQESFARRFHLPELEEDVDGKVEPEKRRPVLDPGPAPKGVKVEESDGVTQFWVETAGFGRVIPWLVWLALPLAVGYFVHMLEPSMAALATGMAAAFVAFQIGMGEIARRRAHAAQPRLCVGGRAIWLGRPGQEPRTKVRFDDLSQVRVARAGGAVRLIVEGGGKRIELSGRPLDQKRMQWIRDKLMQLTGRFY